MIWHIIRHFWSFWSTLTHTFLATYVAKVLNLKLHLHWHTVTKLKENFCIPLKTLYKVKIVSKVAAF